MNTLSDKELKQLFHQQKKEIEDNGFTQNVLKHIPHARTRNYNNRIMGICTLAGILIFFLSGGYHVLIDQVLSFISFIIHMKIPPLESIFIYLLILGGMGGTSLYLKTMDR